MAHVGPDQRPEGREPVALHLQRVEGRQAPIFAAVPLVADREKGILKRLAAKMPICMMLIPRMLGTK